MTDSTRTDLPVAVADTSGLLAFFNPRDPHHDRCRAALRQLGHLVLPPFVLAELDYLLTARAGGPAALQALGYLSQGVLRSRFEVPEVGAHLPAARSVMQTYPDIGLTGAMNVVLAREFRTSSILTLDVKHFRTIRPLTANSAFRLLPFDL
ncbi:PIN domain-containing protein [Kitasatospora sp. MAP5-34]|uniref:PIN domain-containing protein n=1 Tax=Kitasatospora sp. MAP5-34 TaxID=3035102 RepID=UPI002475D99F|nr:PIN domain-containing protein [Kitasatospora sp. MAP5-34]MDH6578338.1 putative nucleic acid-binding protein [Kitasatospora sp. MAP5-34]